MFDGIKLLDVAVDVDALLKTDRLTFGGLVDTQTGFILDPTRRAFDRGLTFRLVPRRNGNGYRLEMKGSLHKFHNNGSHNADQFTIDDLLQTLDELVRSYGFDLGNSKINSIEFGVNVVLPFPVGQVLKNLVCYKNQPFYLDTHSDTPYYVCHFQRHAVKIYDKGKQNGLDYDLLRFEIRVKKMEYLNTMGISLRTLADLLNAANYERLGSLLGATFNEIVFDDPLIKSANLTPQEREIYRNGTNPRYWKIADDLPPKQATAHRQRLSRDRRRYRALFAKYGGDWQKKTAALIGQTWNQLTALTDDLLTRIEQYKTASQSGATCHKLTGIDYSSDECTGDSLPGLTCHELTNVETPTCHKLTDIQTDDLSQINPLYSRVLCDKGKPDQSPEQGVVMCLVTGLVIDPPRPRQRFISSTQLQSLYHTDRRTFDQLTVRFLTAKQVGATLDKQCYYMAHNIRNTYTNQFNNPLRRIKKYQNSKEGQLTLLFPINQIVKVTDRIQAGMDYRRGTRHEIAL